MRRDTYIGAILAGLLALGCGAQTAYVSENSAAAGPYVSRPTTLLFSSEEFILKAEGLTWSDWGQPVATGSGELYQSFGGGGAASAAGTVTLSKPATCNGKLYYAAASFPSGELLTPPSPIRLKTPC